MCPRARKVSRSVRGHRVNHAFRTAWTGRSLTHEHLERIPSTGIVVVPTGDAADELDHNTETQTVAVRAPAQQQIARERPQIQY